jgi:hypothetical protein
MALDIQLLDTQFQGLVSPEIYAADPMLVAPNGVVGLFDTQSIDSWPIQGAPNAANQKWFNRAPNAAIPFLAIGNLLSEENFDPAWSASEQAFVFTKAGGTLISATDLSHFNFTTQGFLLTAWMKPTAIFSTTGNQILVGKYSGSEASSPYSIFLSNGSLYAYMSGASAIGFASAALTYAGNMQIGLSWVPSGATGTAKLYANGKVVATASTPFNALVSGVNFTLGNFSLPIDAFVKRLYIENLTVSQNNPETRVALEYSKLQEILT